MNAKKEPEFDEQLAIALNEIAGEARERLFKEVLDIHNNALSGMGHQDAALQRWTDVIDNLHGLMIRTRSSGAPKPAIRRYRGVCQLCGNAVNYLLIGGFSVARCGCDYDKHNPK